LMTWHPAGRQSIADHAGYRPAFAMTTIRFKHFPPCRNDATLGGCIRDRVQS
jgi:hypothetical protein